MVHLQLGAGVARVVLDDAAHGNALTRAGVSELQAALERALALPELVALVLSARGPSFCEGLALDEELPDAGAIASFERCLALLAAARPVTIAAVEGVACGGGVGLLAACDLVLAGPNARFVLPEARFGLIPATIAPFVLRRLTPARFRALALSMRTLDAAEAQLVGLVDELASELEPALTRQLTALRKAFPPALAAIKQGAFASGSLAPWLARPDVRQRLQGGLAAASPPQEAS